MVLGWWWSENECLVLSTELATVSLYLAYQCIRQKLTFRTLELRLEVLTLETSAVISVCGGQITFLSSQWNNNSNCIRQHIVTLPKYGHGALNIRRP